MGSRRDESIGRFGAEYRVLRTLYDELGTLRYAIPRHAFAIPSYPAGDRRTSHSRFSSPGMKHRRLRRELQTARPSTYLPDLRYISHAAFDNPLPTFLNAFVLVRVLSEASGAPLLTLPVHVFPKWT